MRENYLVKFAPMSPRTHGLKSTRYEVLNGCVPLKWLGRIRWLLQLYCRWLITVTSWCARWRHKSPAPRLFTESYVKKLNLRVTGLCEGNPPVTGEFPSQRASNTGNVSIWWRHHMHWEFSWQPPMLPVRHDDTLELLYYMVHYDMTFNTKNVCKYYTYT